MGSGGVVDWAKIGRMGLEELGGLGKQRQRERQGGCRLVRVSIA